MPTAEGFSFWNFLADVITIFFFIVLLWLLFIVFSDLFRRHDISGWGKALWVIALLLFPYFGVFIYLITQSTGMAERNLQQAQRARDEVRQVVGFSAADEIKKLDELKKSGARDKQAYGLVCLYGFPMAVPLPPTTSTAQSQSAATR
jgi:hypothetical protein